MNTYENISYKNFRKKYAYQRAMEVIKAMVDLIGTIDSFEKSKFFNKSIKIAVELAQGEGNILTVNGKDYHYRRALMYTIQLKKAIEDKLDIGELKESDVTRIILENLQEVIILTRSYRKALREKNIIEEIGEK
ncbi:hypothetical protein CDLVIII_5485 [Clostridium sp. DL-VIII]|uniref:hypothetical protein n=1 Tax=Clostridium sp. DL-VIII TaxID=641107 RepID=UPI00023B0513|nr:hypothetical protein [Clostridium sp. DL-VIII]EHJ01959.1 hypothetical protein CDLVIII_5485 [Clostridium sp. DL-VIII]